MSKVYVICAGCSLTSKKGVLGPGTELKEEYFGDYDAVVKKFDESGIIEEKVEETTAAEKREEAAKKKKRPAKKAVKKKEE